MLFVAELTSTYNGSWGFLRPANPLGRPVSCGSVPLALMSAQATTTTPRRTADDELRAERVSRYKEERRRQLAAHAATRTQNASSQGIAHSAQQVSIVYRAIVFPIISIAR